jgi:dTMP kinase
VLIIFEGVDGTGKGTQIKEVCDWLEKTVKQQIIRTKEPGGTALGDEIRKLVFGDAINSKNLAVGVVDLLFLASHVQNRETVVFPALAEGAIVVSDRWWHSQLAYSKERVSPISIRTAYLEEAKKSVPDLVIFLYTDNFSEMLRRAHERPELHQKNKAWSDVEIQRRIQNNYIALFKDDPNFVVVNVDDKSIRQIRDEIIIHIIARIGKVDVKHA